MLSCATSDGSVAILTVRQSLNSNSSFAPDDNVSLTVQEHETPPSDIDGRAITGMRWANPYGRGVSCLSEENVLRRELTPL